MTSWGPKKICYETFKFEEIENSLEKIKLKFNFEFFHLNCLIKLLTELIFGNESFETIFKIILNNTKSNLSNYFYLKEIIIVLYHILYIKFLF